MSTIISTSNSLPLSNQTDSRADTPFNEAGFFGKRAAITAFLIGGLFPSTSNIEARSNFSGSNLVASAEPLARLTFNPNTIQSLQNNSPLTELRVRSLPGIGDFARGIINNYPSIRAKFEPYKQHEEAMRIGESGKATQGELLGWADQRRKIKEDFNRLFEGNPFYTGLDTSRAGFSEVSIYGLSGVFSGKGGKPLGVGVDLGPFKFKTRFPQGKSAFQNFLEIATKPSDLNEDLRSLSQLEELLRSDPELKAEIFAPLIQKFLERDIDPKESAVLEEKAKLQGFEADLAKMKTKLDASQGSKQERDKISEGLDEKKIEEILKDLTASKSLSPQDKLNLAMGYSNALRDLAIAIDPGLAKEADFLANSFNLAACAISLSYGNVMAGPQLLSSTAALYSTLFGKKRADPDQERHKQVMEALGKISDQINTLHLEMREQFIVVNEKLDHIITIINNYFSAVQDQLRGISIQNQRILASLDVLKYLTERNELWSQALYQDHWQNRTSELEAIYTDIGNRIRTFSKTYGDTDSNNQTAVLTQIITDIERLSAHVIPSGIQGSSTYNILFKDQVVLQGVEFSYPIIEAQLRAIGAPKSEPAASTPHPVAFSYALSLLKEAGASLPFARFNINLDPKVQTFKLRGADVLNRAKILGEGASLQAAANEYVNAYNDLVKELKLALDRIGSDQEQAADSATEIVNRKNGIQPAGLPLTVLSEIDMEQGTSIGPVAVVPLLDLDNVGQIKNLDRRRDLAPSYSSFSIPTLNVLVAGELPRSQHPLQQISLFDTFIKYREPKFPYTISNTALAPTLDLAEMFTLGAYIRPDSQEFPVGLDKWREFGLRFEITPTITSHVEQAAISNNIRDENPTNRFGLGRYDEIKYTDTIYRVVNEYFDLAYQIEVAWPEVQRDEATPPLEKKLDKLALYKLTVSGGPETRRVLGSSAKWKDSEVVYLEGTVHRGGNAKTESPLDGTISYSAPKTKQLDEWQERNIFPFISTPAARDAFYREKIYDFWHKQVAPDTEQALRLIRDISSEFDLTSVESIELSSRHVQSDIDTEGRKQIEVYITINYKQPDNKQVPSDLYLLKITFKRPSGDNPGQVDINIYEHGMLEVGTLGNITSGIVTQDLNKGPEKDVRLPYEIRENGFTLVLKPQFTEEQLKQWRTNASVFKVQQQKALLSGLLKHVEKDEAFAIKIAAQRLDNARVLLLCLGSEGLGDLVDQDRRLFPAYLPDSARLFNVMNAHNQARGDVNTALLQFEREVSHSIDSFRSALGWALQQEAPKGFGLLTKQLESL